MLSANEAKQATLNARKSADGRIPEAVAHIERQIRNAMAQGLSSVSLEFLGGVGFAMIPQILDGVKAQLIQNGYRILPAPKDEIFLRVTWIPDEIKETE